MLFRVLVWIEYFYGLGVVLGILEYIREIVFSFFRLFFVIEKDVKFFSIFFMGLSFREY